MRLERYVVTRSQIESVDTLCAGIVTRSCEEDACCKNATTIVYDLEGANPWPACTWHAHRYGGALTLAEVREALETGATWIEREARDEW